jgi:hypothetical protein
MVQLVQLLGGCVVIATLIFSATYVWLTWFKPSAAGQSAIGKIITGILESSQLTGNLGYVELLRRVDAVEASPEASVACDVVADCLWAAAKASWQQAQQSAVSTTATPTITVKIADISGRIFDVGVVTEEPKA